MQGCQCLYLWLALLVLQIRRGCERNVITYSSLISACEKAGRWELALDLFSEMHREGCKPNVVTYNSLIAACAQGTVPCHHFCSASELLYISSLAIHIIVADIL